MQKQVSHDMAQFYYEHVQFCDICVNAVCPKEKQLMMSATDESFGQCCNYILFPFCSMLELIFFLSLIKTWYCQTDAKFCSCEVILCNLPSNTMPFVSN